MRSTSMAPGMVDTRWGETVLALSRLVGKANPHAANAPACFP